MGLVHLGPGIGGGLLVGAGGGIGGTIESLKTGEEGACADVERVGILVDSVLVG